MPQIIKVFQIVIDKDLSDLINKEGWDCHVDAKAYIEAQEGRASIGLANGSYTHVANIVADRALEIKREHSAKKPGHIT